MAESDILVDGKPLSSLRVVDLKDELEKRHLSKSGNKKQLMDRLKLVSSNQASKSGLMVVLRWPWDQFKRFLAVTQEHVLKMNI